jgi:Ca-activated chloride channel homolog
MLKLLPDVFQRAGDRWRGSSRGTAAILPPRSILFIPAFLICLGLNPIGPWLAAQFSSGVSLVEVYATVLDRGGQPVEQLTQADFIVEEDGRERPIAVFSAGDIPLSVAVAIDRSFSVAPRKLAEMVTSTQRFLGELRPEDRVMMLGVGSEVETLAPLSLDHRAAYDALTGLTPWGTTPLFDATVSALDAIQSGSGRRALILISDGNDRYSQTSAAGVLEAARLRDVMVYPVAVQKTVPPVFAELANASGGRSLAAPDGRTLASSLSAIATELRRQYLIGYAPGTEAADSSTRWRTITVRTRTPGLRVRARAGYYAVR